MTSSLLYATATARNDHDYAIQVGVKEATVTTATIASATAGAYSAGAGALAGYAGIASTVSSMGLGSVTTAAAGMLGSSAVGAAATAVVTSALGGPLVAGGLLVLGTGAAAYGVCRTLGSVWDWFTD